MKKITLYSASTRNNGAYVDAGATVDIGDGAWAIDADRAKAMVEIGTAVSETAARADARAAAED